MSQSFKIIGASTAIEKLKRIKNLKQKILVCTVNFDTSEESSRFCPLDECYILVTNSKTIIFNGDDFLSHLQLYSVLQEDISNLIRCGVMHNIILIKI